MRKCLDLDNNRYNESKCNVRNITNWTTYTAGQGLGMGSALASHRNLE